MGISDAILDRPLNYLRAVEPNDPVLFFSPRVLAETASRFQRGFPGLVTFAVKANASDDVLVTLLRSGVSAFDVASTDEIAQLRRLAPHAALHYNNPVRSRREIAFAAGAGVKSFSVDSPSELEKLIEILPAEGTEISVRFKLPVKGAAYDFGSKFGAEPDMAVELLTRVAEAGFIPSLTFHPGTQCATPAPWVNYIETAAEIAERAGVRVARLNTGGGFPAYRVSSEVISLDAIFDTIRETAARVFGDNGPELLCEPGRAMVAECMVLATRVRAIRHDGAVFLNDGVYGALAEMPLIGAIDRVEVLSPEAEERRGDPVARVIFGPTCDSMDRLPGTFPLPGDMQEDDFVLFRGMGAYSNVTSTRFNGFGHLAMVNVDTL